MVFGRIAGRTAVGMTDSSMPLPEDTARTAGSPADASVEAMRASLSEVMRASLNVVRDRKGLESGLAEIDRMLESLGDFSSCYERFRLYNDLLTAKITMVSALERRSDVGCHCRSDSVEESEKYRIEIKFNGEGMDVHRKPV